jgi:RHS repeat-associated protein
MRAISLPRLQTWKRVVRYWDSIWALSWAHISVTLENASEALGPTQSSSRRKSRPVQLAIDVLEPRFFPGQTTGVLGWGLVGTGLGLVDRALAGSLSPAGGASSSSLPPGGGGLGWGGDSDPAHPHTIRIAKLTPDDRARSATLGSPVSFDISAWNNAQIVGQQYFASQPDPGAVNDHFSMSTGLAAEALADPLVDPLVDVLTGASMKPKPPPAQVLAPDPGRASTYADSGGGYGSHAPSSYGADSSSAPTANYQSPAALNIGSSPTLGAGQIVGSPNALTTRTRHGLLLRASSQQVTPPAPAASAHPKHKKPDPMWVLDVNKANVVTPGVTEHEFSNWSMDLRAQVSGATVSTYSWNMTSAPDATSVSGTSTYRLQFTWANFSGAARTDTISITETPMVGSAVTQTMTFLVASTSSPAYVSTPPTSSTTWPNVLPPDTLTNLEATASGGALDPSMGGPGCACSQPNAEAQTHEPPYRLGLAAGDLETVHHIHSYNPGVPPLHLVYSSTAANALPIFITHFQIDPSQAVPSTVSAQLTFNSVAGSTFYYSTSSLNPGDTMQIALQADATALSTGRYSYQVSVTANYATPVTTTYSGSADIVNSSSSPYGAGWSLDAVQRLWPVTGGVILELPGGTSLWFANGGTSGTFVTPAGDFSTLAQNTGTGVYTRTMKDGTKINFDSTGKQTSVVDRNGTTLTFAYNASNLLSTITDAYNQVTSFSYNAQNRVSTIQDPANRVVSLGYDASNRLTSIADPDGALWTYGYDSANRMTTLTNARSYNTTFAYNFAGRVASVTRPDATTDQLSALQIQGLVPAGSGTQGNPATAVLAAQAQASYTDPRNNVWLERLDWLGFGRAAQAQDPLSDMTISYRDANGLPWLVSDPLGRRTRSNFDSSGNPTKITLPDDNTRQYAYNGFSEPTSFTDETSATTTYTYDANGNLTQVKDALGDITTYTNNTQGFVTSMTDPLNHTTSYGYDTRNRRTTQTDPLNNVTSYGYDAASNQTTVIDPRGFTTSFAYDSGGNLLSKQLPDSNPANHPTFTYTYDALDNRVSLSDPLNHTTTYGYDGLNRQITMRDPLNNVTTYAYDADGNQTTVTDPLNHTTTSAYDAANRLIAVTDPLNDTTTYTLDAGGQRTVVTDALNNATTYAYTSRGQVSVMTDPNDNKTTYSYSASLDVTAVTKTYNGAPQIIGDANHPTITYTYDSIHRNTKITDQQTHATTLVYDVASRETSSKDALNHVTTFGYDNANRFITIRDALNNVTTYGYDADGNKISVTDPLGRTTTYAYDAQNRLVTVTDPRNGVTTYAYDLAGRQISITDSVGNTTSYGYDAANRQTSVTDPLGTATFVYDAAGRKTDTTDRAGRRRTFGYDAANRLTSENWFDASGNSKLYVYDADNRLTVEGDLYSQYNFTYDGAGRLIESDNFGSVSGPFVELTYTYDNFDRRINLTDNFGGSVTYSYDKANRMLSAAMQQNGTQGPAINLSYDNANNLTSASRNTGGTANITSAWSYDSANRLTTITHSSSVAGALATYTYAYDGASQLTQYTGPEGTLTYTYDNNGQLTKVGNARTENYTYDVNGNRTMTGYTTASGNRLTGDGTNTYSYDAEGNMISKTRLSDSQQTQYTWDFGNRLTQVVIKTCAGVTVTNDVFTYDVEDRRIGNSVNGTQQWFSYDGKNTYADFDGTGALTMVYLSGAALDRLYARFNGTTTAWYLTDKLGSVRKIANTSGTGLDALTYDSFGNILTETNASNGDRFKYTSREWDSAIGLEYNRARYDDPKAGRWIGEDPIRFTADDTNLYRYVRNAPTSSVDPLGLDACEAAHGAMIKEALHELARCITRGQVPVYVCTDRYKAAQERADQWLQECRQESPERNRFPKRDAINRTKDIHLQHVQSQGIDWGTAVLMGAFVIGFFATLPVSVAATAAAGVVFFGAAYLYNSSGPPNYPAYSGQHMA